MMDWTCEHYTEWATQVAPTLGELVGMGFFDWENDESWKFDAPSDEVYQRLCKKFVNRNYYREIGIEPLARWKMAYLEKLAEIMPKYKLLYKALDDGIDIMQDSDDYGKERRISSEFPETLLNGNSDYASTGNDYEYERIHEGSALDKLEQFANSYNDVDVMVLDELDFLFSSLMTGSVPMF